MFYYHEQIEKQDVGGGIILQVLGRGANMNVLHWNFADKSVVPMHQHVHEQFGYILKGGFEVVVGDETAVLKAGDSYFIPSNVPHMFTAIGETEAIDIFSPVRLDIPFLTAQ